MEDQEVAQPALDNTLIEPRTVPTPPAEKRTRQRPKRGGATTADALDSYEAAVEGETAPEKPKRVRASRSSRLTAADVCGAVNLASSLAAMFTQQAHWVIPETEVKPWAADAAELLNRIPSRYVRAASDMSGFITVGVGVYGCMKPRIDESARINAARRQDERERARRIVEEATAPDTADVPWGAV